MNSFIFNNPVKLHVGPGKFALLGSIAHQYGKKALLVVSDNTKSTGLLARAQETLAAAGVAFAVYDKFMQNPLSTLVEAGAEMARQEQCDLVIGIGGGSAMDMAQRHRVLCLQSRQYLGLCVWQSPGTERAAKYLGADHGRHRQRG